MTITERARLRWAVARFDFWLDFRGVPSRRRRQLRAELRANLSEATEHEGSTRAVLALGSLRAMAYDVADAYPERPRWAFGAYTAMAGALLLLSTWAFSVLGFLAGVRASGVTDRPVTGAVPPWGGEVVADLGPAGGAFEVSALVPWTLVLVVLVVFLLAAQPWRPFTHRDRREAALGA